MTSVEHGGTWGSPHYDALEAEIAGLRAQVEDLRQSKTVAALGHVARDACALLNAMSDADEIRAAGESLEPVGFDERRGALAASLRAFIQEAEADLAAAARRSVELQRGPLAVELAAERSADLDPANWSERERDAERDAAKLFPSACLRSAGAHWLIENGYEPDPFAMECPGCHGTKKVRKLDLVPGDGPGTVEEVVVTCPRCEGSGRLDSFGWPLARGRGAS